MTYFDGMIPEEDELYCVGQLEQQQDMHNKEVNQKIQNAIELRALIEDSKIQIWVLTKKSDAVLNNKSLVNGLIFTIRKIDFTPKVEFIDAVNIIDNTVLIGMNFSFWLRKYKDFPLDYDFEDIKNELDKYQITQ